MAGRGGNKFCHRGHAHAHALPLPLLLLPLLLGVHRPTWYRPTGLTNRERLRLAMLTTATDANTSVSAAMAGEEDARKVSLADSDLSVAHTHKLPMLLTAPQLPGVHRKQR